MGRAQTRTDDDAGHRQAERDEDQKEFVVELSHRRVVLAALRRGGLDGEALAEDDAHARHRRHVRASTAG